MLDENLMSKGTIFVCPKDNTVKEFTVEFSEYETNHKNCPCEENCDISDCPIKK